MLRKFLGGDDGNRTHDPLLAGQVLSQLSYTPMVVGFSVLIYRTLKIEQQADLCHTLLTQYASSRRLLLFAYLQIRDIRDKYLTFSIERR